MQVLQQGLLPAQLCCLGTVFLPSFASETVAMKVWFLLGWEGEGEEMTILQLIQFGIVYIQLCIAVSCCYSGFNRHLFSSGKNCLLAEEFMGKVMLRN